MRARRAGGLRGEGCVAQEAHDVRLLPAAPSRLFPSGTPPPLRASSPATRHPPPAPKGVSCGWEMVARHGVRSAVCAVGGWRAAPTHTCAADPPPSNHQTVRRLSFVRSPAVTPVRSSLPSRPTRRRRRRRKTAAAPSGRSPTYPTPPPPPARSMAKRGRRRGRKRKRKRPATEPFLPAPRNQKPRLYPPNTVFTPPLHFSGGLAHQVLSCVLGNHRWCPKRSLFVVAV